MTGKIPKFPKAKLNSAIHKQLHKAKIKQKKVLSLVWLQYLLAMQKLAVAAQEKAKEEKRNFVNGGHVKAVSHKNLRQNKS